MNLLNNILSNIWFISESEKTAWMPLVASMLKGEYYISLAEQKELMTARDSVLSFDGAVEYGSFKNGFDVNNQTNRVGVVNLNGVMMKQDGLCSYGTDSVYNLLKAAGTNAYIKSVVLMTNSPGGAADSSEGIYNLVKNFKSTYKKPVVSIIDGTAASAAYYAISGSDKIISTGNSVGVGSIGTYASLLDVREYLANNGIREVVVKATDSVNKNSAWEAALNGDNEPLRKEVLDPLQRGFKQAVLKGRKGLDSSSDVFGGGMYYGKDAFKKGLVDEILNKEDAFDYAMRLGNNLK